jgi:hypothetical protein
VVIQVGSDGELDFAALTADERKEIYDSIMKTLQTAQDNWYEKYGPFETLSLSDMSVEEQNAKLDAVDDSLIWADVNYDTGSSLSPVEGLTLGLNGWAKVPGRDNFSDTGEDFLIATKPWEGSPYGFEPVYSFAQCLCPFCEDGEIEGEECNACWGNGSLEFEL